VEFHGAKESRPLGAAAAPDGLPFIFSIAAKGLGTALGQHRCENPLFLVPTRGRQKFMGRMKDTMPADAPGLKKYPRRLTTNTAAAIWKPITPSWG